MAEYNNIAYNLWKKDTNEGTGTYIELFIISTQKPEESCRKCNTKADKHLEAGNGLLDQNIYNEAVEEFNRSLRFAEMGSESVGLAYANRARCFLQVKKYDSCLVDIDLALKSNYPQKCIPELMQCKADCMAKREQQRFVKPVLSYPPNNNYPGMANAIQFKQKEPYGRQIVATRDIPVGQTLLIEPVFAVHNTFRGAICSSCRRSETNLIACENCTKDMFCSADCLNSSRYYHTLKCGYEFDDPGCLVQPIFMAIDACGGDVDKSMAFVEEVRNEPAGIPASTVGPLDKYRAALQLNMCKMDTFKLDFAPIAYCAVITIPKMAELFGTLAKRRFLMHLLGMHEIIMRDNGFTEFVKNTSPKNEYSVHRLGLITALVNHECFPNVNMKHINNNLVSYTIRPIKKDQQLFLSYAKIGEENPGRYVLEKFGFQCKCSKCDPGEVPFDDLALKWDPVFMTIYGLVHGEKDEQTWNEIKMLSIPYLNEHGHHPHCRALEFVMKNFANCPWP